MILPTEIQSLLDDGTLRRVSDDEFVIDALRHRERTGVGWITVIYELRIEEDDAGQPVYEIAEATREIGNDIVISSDDPDEVSYWITEQIQEMER